MRQARSGFTLIEVLVAVTIMAVGVVALAGSSATVTRMIGRGKIDTRAAQLATQQLEVAASHRLLHDAALHRAGQRRPRDHRPRHPLLDRGGRTAPGGT